MAEIEKGELFMDAQQKKIRVLLIAGSSRSVYNCPGADSKASYFVERFAETLPNDWVVDIFNIGNDYLLPKIQSCNGCVSTSMALCVWPCNCYKRHSFFEPDLMWDEDLYGRFYAADAIVICAPVNWYGPTSSLKLLFDRLSCANGGNPNDKLIRHKDATLAAKLESSQDWGKLSLNHLEGRTAFFFVYGDDGNEEMGSDGAPKILKHKAYFDTQEEKEFSTPYNAYRPIFWQCRYSGIEVPEELILGLHFGGNGKYHVNQIEQLKQNKLILDKFDIWANAVISFIEKKGKVDSGAYPVSLSKPDSQLHPFLRQLQLMVRLTLGSLWMHSIGYFTSRKAAKKLSLKEQ